MSLCKKLWVWKIPHLSLVPPNTPTVSSNVGEAKIFLFVLLPYKKRNELEGCLMLRARERLQKPSLMLWLASQHSTAQGGRDLVNPLLWVSDRPNLVHNGSMRKKAGKTCCDIGNSGASIRQRRPHWYVCHEAVMTILLPLLYDYLRRKAEKSPIRVQSWGWVLPLISFLCYRSLATLQERPPRFR